MKKLLIALLMSLASVCHAEPRSITSQACGVVPLPDGKHQLRRYCVKVDENKWTDSYEKVYVVETLKGDIVAGATTDYMAGKAPQAITSVVPAAGKPTASSSGDKPSSKIWEIRTGERGRATYWVSATCSSLAPCVEIAQALSAKSAAKFTTTPNGDRTEITFDNLSANERLDMLAFIAKQK
jgi:hypothetical protein